MKKLLFAILLAGLFSVSCTVDPVKLDGTSWTVVSYEDYFNGSVVFRDNISGHLDWETYGDDAYIYLTVPEFYLTDEKYDAEEYRIVKYTKNELVVDFWYYEYDQYTESECDYIETFKGKKMYYAYYDPVDKSKYSIVYFKGIRRSVDCDIVEPEGKDKYYYDCTRIYCKR